VGEELWLMHVGIAERVATRGSGRGLVALIVGLCLIRVIAAGLLLSVPDTFDHRSGLIGDVRRWHSIANAPGVPYRDVHIEYPPVTWAAAELVSSGTVHDSAVTLVWSQLALDLLTAAALFYGWGRRAGVAYLVLGLTLVAWPFVYIRLDLLPVVLASWGLALIARRRPVAGGITLAIACFAKVWPLVLFPLLAVQRRSRALIAATVTGAVGLGAWLAWGGTAGPRDVLTFRGAKGWQIESVGGALIRALGNARVHTQEGAWRVGHLTPIARDLSGLVLLATVAATSMLLARIRPPSAGLTDGVAALTVVAALLACSPIFSPQYAVWLLPFAAIAAAYRAWVPATLAALTCALSTGLMRGYLGVVRGAPWAEALLMTRNLMLIAVIVSGFVSLTRARHPAHGRRACGSPLAPGPVSSERESAIG
jgi:Glycosyltransferase family 87